MSRTKLVLSQKLHLAQKLFLATTILNKPITAIDNTIDAIIDDPNIVERVPQPPQVESGGIRSSNYSSLLERLMDNKKGSGTPSGADQFVPISGNSIVVNLGEHAIAQPDISYIVRGYGDFTIKHSEQFRRMEPELKTLQIPRNVQPFLRWLINQRNWIADSLLQVYLAIGKKQADFLLSLEPQQLVVFPRARLPSETGTNYDESTYYRLLQGRSVGIQSPNGTAVFPVAFLLPTKDQVLAYNAIPKMNTVFEEEFANKRAYSDTQIQRRIGGAIARRTISKYRLLADIPDQRERQAQYNQGVSTPYKVLMAIEAYLPNR